VQLSLLHALFLFYAAILLRKYCRIMTYFSDE